MKSDDTKKRGSKDAQEAIRKKGFRLLKQGKSVKFIAETLDVSSTIIYRWKKTFKTDGAKGSKSKVRGRTFETKRRLSLDQEAQVITWIKDTTPEQLKFKFALWSRAAVTELIKEKFDIALPIRTMGEYLKRWGFTPQRPIKRAYEQDDKEVKKWLEEKYPKIKKRAIMEGAQIQWADETSNVSVPSNIRGYAPKGKTPVLLQPATKFKVNMISSITNRGSVNFMIFDDKRMNQDIFIEFLEKLIKGSKTKIFLIVDNLRPHHGEIVKNWVKKMSKKIELFYIPAYCPELNPDEYLNCDLKATNNRTGIPKDAKGLKSNTNKFMTLLQKSPQRVKNYFKHPKIKYAS